MINLIKPNLFVLILFLGQLAHSEIKPGQWSTGCKNGLKKEQIYGANNRVITTESFYQDQHCLNESFRFQTIGLINYYRDSDQFIDFLYEEIYLSIYKQNVIADFNTRKVCGISDWSLARAQNIKGLKCAIFNLNRPTQIPYSGEIKYGIFYLAENKLYYGKLSQELNATSPEKRPNQINFATEYILQH